jgi:type I restriction enzyme S subunit
MSFPRYPKYQTSGVKWLGDVPEHWISIRYKNVFKEKRSVSGTSLPSGSISFGRVVFKADKLLNELTKATYQEVLAGEFLINPINLNYDLKSLRTGLSDIDTCVSPAYIVLQSKKTSDKIYLKYQLHLFDVSHMKTLGAGVRQTITFGDIGTCSTCLPPLAEQSAIAAFLDRETGKIDELVAEQRRLMELLKEKRQAVISHAVTQGLNPQAPMKPSGIEWLGNVPEHWTVIKLGRAVFMQEGPGLRNWQFTAEGTRVICVTNITEAGIDFNRLEKFISTEEYNSSYRHFTVQRGDVLLSSSGNSWGKVAIYEGEEKVILNTSTIRLNQSKDAPLHRDYIALLLQSDTIREQLGLAMTGSCQPNFGPTHLNSVMVAIPPSDEQVATVASLNGTCAKLDLLIAEAQRAIDLLQERRTALISAAVTGQIDVRAIASN